MSKGDKNLDLLPVRMLDEFIYCPRLFYLEYVDGDFEESADTVEGRRKHTRVDKMSGNLPIQSNIETGTRIHATSVTLSSPSIGLISKLDLIEGDDKKVSPVEYKRGKPPDSPDMVWPSDLAQIVAQAIILRENGYVCEEGFIYYSATRQRIRVPVTRENVDWVTRETKRAVEISESEIIPEPLSDSPKCVRCSLVSICLPDEINSIMAMEEETKADREIRRLYPARQEQVPMYVQEQGAVVSKKGDELIVKKDGNILGKGRLMEISSLSLFGNVQVSTQVVRELLNRNISICYFSSGGWFTGLTYGMSHKNVELRKKQFYVASDERGAVRLARKFVEGKIRNSRTLLMRNAKGDIKSALLEMKLLTERATESEDPEELLGLEGLAGRIYFGHFKDMFKPRIDDFPFDFEGRNRRPPKDPVNALLSYLYALLSKDMMIALLSVGLDPFLGFYHRPKYGKPALALDMMEEFRPIVCDSVAITMINSGEIKGDDFISRGGAFSLDSTGKKNVIRAYERRLDSLITHTIFDYSISYRRVFEIQVRLLGRFLKGEIPEYPVFLTR